MASTRSSFSVAARRVSTVQACLGRGTCAWRSSDASRWRQVLPLGLRPVQDAAASGPGRPRGKRSGWRREVRRRGRARLARLHGLLGSQAPEPAGEDCLCDLIWFQELCSPITSLPITRRSVGSSRSSRDNIRWFSFSAAEAIVPRIAGSMKDSFNFTVGSRQAIAGWSRLARTTSPRRMSFAPESWFAPRNLVQVE